MKTQNLFRGILILFSIFYLPPLFAQTESKVAVITVSGSGKTQDEAKQNALRNSIEQAFGTYISSNTQILNDELVKDEIVSVSNGNIQEYIVISEIQMPDGSWSINLTAKVAIDKLTSFCESKGVNVEFKGSLFALNVKQQMLNETNELKILQNTRIVLKALMNKAFDYTIKVDEPTSSGDKWVIPVEVTGTINNNIANISSYLFQTLRGISCTQSEYENYLKLKKEIFYVAFKPMNAKGQEASLFVLRNEDSFGELKSIINDLKQAFQSVIIENGIQSKSPPITTSSSSSDSYSNVQSVLFNLLLWEDVSFNGYGPRAHDERFLSGKDFRYVSTSLRTVSNTYRVSTVDQKYFNANWKFLNKWEFLVNESIGERPTYVAINFANLTIGKSKGIIKYQDKYSLDEIQKISEYKIKVR